MEVGEALGKETGSLNAGMDGGAEDQRKRVLDGSPIRGIPADNLG